MRRIHASRPWASWSWALVDRVRLAYFAGIGKILSRSSSWYPNTSFMSAQTGDGAPARPRALADIGLACLLMVWRSCRMHACPRQLPLCANAANRTKV